VVDSLSSFIEQKLYDDVPELCNIKSPSKQALVPATTLTSKRARTEDDDIEESEKSKPK
jgi:hypothetical protein